MSMLVEIPLYNHTIIIHSVTYVRCYCVYV